MLAWIFSSQCSLRLLGGPGLVPSPKRGTGYLRLALLACLTVPLVLWVRDHLEERDWIVGTISNSMKSLESSVATKAFKGLRCDPEVTNSDLDQLKIWSKIRQFLSDNAVRERASKCDGYFEQMLQFSAHASLDKFMGQTGKADDDSSNFTIAFSHAVHHHVGLFELFLALYFRPKNVHCIHVDIKSSKLFKESVKYLVDCYNAKFGTADALFFADYPTSVYWGHPSVLESDLICLRQLLKHKVKWDMYVNLAGSELPLVPYETFEATLKTASEAGHSIVSSFSMPKRDSFRVLKSFYLRRNGPDEFNKAMRHSLTKSSKTPANDGIVVFKGLKNVALTREFSTFLVRDNLALNYLNWLSDAFISDEHFYSTLVRVTVNNVTREVTQNTDPAFDPTHGVCMRESLWSYPLCQGRSIRDICNLGVADLGVARRRNCLVGNKFNLDVNSSAGAAICAVRHIRNLTDVE